MEAEDVKQDASSSDKTLHIRSVLSEQFSTEISYKEEELQQLEDRIRLAKMMLRRLRLGVLAQHFGLAGFYNPNLDYSDENIGVQGNWETFETEFHNGGCKIEASSDIASETQVGAPSTATLKSGQTANDSTCESMSGVSSEVRESQTSFVCRDDDEQNEEETGSISNGNSLEKTTSDEDLRNSVTSLKLANLGPKFRQFAESVNSKSYVATAACAAGSHSHPSVSRFYSKKRVIVGNTSQYIDSTTRSHGDGASHKWMVYVRGPNEEADISHFVKAVRFFLHPSYHPNDIIVISKPPFHLTRLGWGEFPIRAQLEFCDARNKPIDIIHNLVLDRTHTGQQTLGAETVVDLEITLSEESSHSGPPLPNGVVQSHGVMNGHLANEEAACSVVSPHTVVKTERSNSAASDMKESRSAVFHSQVKIEPTKTLNDSTVEDGMMTYDKCLSPQPLIIQHITLPVTSPADMMLLDHDYCANVVVSCIEKPTKQAYPQQPAVHAIESTDEMNSLVLTNNLDRCLHSAVGSVPLYGALSEDYMLSAASLSQYRSWSVGRRRACEWMRAVAVRKLLQKKLRISSLLTTKQVMDWCRKNGYTPLDLASQSGPGFCKYCGCELDPREITSGETTPEYTIDCHRSCRETFEGERDSFDSDSSQEESDEVEKSKDITALLGRRFSTVSSPFQLFSEVISQQTQLDRKEKSRLQEQTVDVESVPHDPRTSKRSDLIPRFRIPQTPELKWVQQTAGSLGVRIYPAVIDQMYAHVIEHMIFMACSRFLRAVLTQAVQEGGSSVESELSRERILTPLHVYQAVQNLELCDFLTNQHFSLEESESVSSDESDED